MSAGTPIPRDVIRGERPSAKQTNDQSRAIQSLIWLRNQIYVSRARAWSESMLHGIIAVEDDFLRCVRIYVRKKGDPIVGTVEFLVARPERLRASETTRDGVTYTYTDTQTRTATKGADTETQRVTPSYLIGEIIEARPLRGLSGVDDVDEQRRALVDANTDGRAWAAEPEAS